MAANICHVKNADKCRSTRTTMAYQSSNILDTQPISFLVVVSIIPGCEIFKISLKLSGIITAVKLSLNRWPRSAFSLHILSYLTSEIPTLSLVWQGMAIIIKYNKRRLSYKIKDKSSCKSHRLTSPGLKRDSSLILYDNSLSHYGECTTTSINFDKEAASCFHNVLIQVCRLILQNAWQIKYPNGWSVSWNFNKGNSSSNPKSAGSLPPDFAHNLPILHAANCTWSNQTEFIMPPYSQSKLNIGCEVQE